MKKESIFYKLIAVLIFSLFYLSCSSPTYENDDDVTPLGGVHVNSLYWLNAKVKVKKDLQDALNWKLTSAD